LGSIQSQLFELLRALIIIDVLYWKLTCNLPSQYLQDISTILNTKKYPPSDEIVTAVRTYLTNTANYTYKPTASANPKAPIQLNVAVRSQKRRGERLFSPYKRLETDDANP